MEGVSSEAASLAGHLCLGRLIYLYDDNQVSIDGPTDLAFTEDRGARFEAYGWQVQHVDDGNDVQAIDDAIQRAKVDPRPSLIVCRTIIGYGAPTKQGTAKAHGEPLGDEELDAAKRALGWPVQPRFLIPDDVLEFYRRAVDAGGNLERDWQSALDAYAADFPELRAELERRIEGRLPEDWQTNLPQFDPDPKGMATRAASGKVLEVLAKSIPELVGGSADLTPSNNTKFPGATDFQRDNPQGRYLRFGVREHAMGTAINGITAYGGMIPYVGTFLIFSDYMRPAIRIAAISHFPSIYVFTHDSVGLGEDGPTHQPVEHLMSLRAMPNLVVIRPCDANEVGQAWKLAILRREGPTALALTRQAVPVLEGTRERADVARGAYVLADFGEPQLILVASGSEVSLVMEAARALTAEGVGVRVVSFPCWELFEMQSREYRDSVFSLPVGRRLAVEAGSGLGWERYAASVISLERFGASAPYRTIFDNLGFTVDNVLARARGLLMKEERAAGGREA
jgi:transketolase